MSTSKIYHGLKFKNVYEAKYTNNYNYQQDVNIQTFVIFFVICDVFGLHCFTGKYYVLSISLHKMGNNLLLSLNVALNLTLTNAVTLYDPMIS